MTYDYKTACVFGGTGFIGRQVVRELARAGYRVKVATRFPEGAYFLRTCGTVGQIVPVFCDYKDEKSVENAVKDCDAVVNLIGILFEKGKNKFQRIHVDLPQAIAKACSVKNIQRLVHISALGADKGTSHYARSKRDGERAVMEEFPQATILRPSVVFGAEDDFFNKFARLSLILPALPLIGGGKTKFQPVYVGDVADAVLQALTMPAAGKENPQGKIYELGGPEILTFREIYQRLFGITGRKRYLLSLPWGLAKIQGAFMSLMPRPLLTRDQVESLRTNNIVTPGMPGFAELNIQPQALHTILPTYMQRYSCGGRFGDNQAA